MCRAADHVGSATEQLHPTRVEVGLDLLIIELMGLTAEESLGTADETEQPRRRTWHTLAQEARTTGDHIVRTWTLPPAEANADCEPGRSTDRQAASAAGGRVAVRLCGDELETAAV